MINPEGIELLGAPQSIYVRTTRMAFEEKGVAYSLSVASPGAARVNAIHPFGKIPVMRHGNFTLFESKAITTYIDLLYDGPALVPKDPHTAGRVEQWISAINTSIFPAAVPYMQANVFLKGPQGTRDEKVVEESVPKIGHFMKIMDNAVSASGHLAGERFSPSKV